MVLSFSHHNIYIYIYVNFFVNLFKAAYLAKLFYMIVNELIQDLRYEFDELIRIDLDQLVWF